MPRLKGVKSKRKRKKYIQKSRYYPWYYRGLEINLIPVAFFSLAEAYYTMEKNYGKAIFQTIKFIKGRDAILKGWKLGKNSFYHNGKWKALKVFHIPPECTNRWRYRREMYRQLVTGTNLTAINRMLRYYYRRTYERRGSF